ncbi:MAG: FAD-binding oxidoreductase [Rhodobacteraceae bacterium]|nr:FAD-binding oxidoreductase [Paracoccaceae bacterium]
MNARPEIALAIVQALAARLGPGAVVTDLAELTIMGNDLFFWDNVVPPACMVRPTSPDEVVAVVEATRTAGAPLFMRGGGMSYTNAYGPQVPGGVLVDLGGLDKIREVDVVNRYIVVEAGCTWKQIVQALAPHSMAVDFPAPLSGSHSTVGGALSQNVPGGMQGVLGLEVVLADGSVVHTGAWASRRNAKPFIRNYGPDLTGMFLGDNGVLGIKTAAALHIKPRARGAAFASFAFENYADLAQTMIELSPFDFITRRTGLCPYETQNIAKVGLGDAIKTVAQVIAAEKSKVSGLIEAAKMAAAGRNFLDGVKWSFHIKSEAVSTAAAEEGIALARAVCLKRGRELPPILPRAREAVGFSIRKFLGKDGERWIATSSVWPIARAVEIADAVEDFVAARRVELDRHGIVVSYITNFSPYYFLCEPCFYWRDELSPLHLRNLPADEAERFKSFAPNPAARAVVKKTREEMRDLFHSLGSIHVQVGDFYRFQSELKPEALALLKTVKRALDPERRLNPGKLDGLSG